jgi:cyanophycin synthetase
MGQPGDLLLVFADALTRSWKQVIKFKAEGVVAAAAPAPVAAAKVEAAAADDSDGAAAAPLSDDGALHAAGFIRDERGLRYVGEAAD